MPSDAPQTSSKTKRPLVLLWHPQDNSRVYYRPQCWPMPDPRDDRDRFNAAIRATPLHAEATRGAKQLSSAELSAEVHNAWRRIHCGDVEAEDTSREVRIAKTLERLATTPHAFPFPNTESYE